MTYTVVYGTGGYNNTVWNRCAPTSDIYKARDVRDEIVKGGRPAYITETAKLDVIGLPEGPSPRWDYVNLCWKPIEVWKRYV